MTFRNEWYNLLSMNFHVKSEHTFRGKHFPAEIHLVHKKYDSEHVVVIALPVEEGAENKMFATLLSKDNIPGELKMFREHTPELDFNALTAGKEYFMYKGSLTAPPCYEIVTWFVQRRPITMSKDQLDALQTAIFNGAMGFGNYRSTMPAMGRPIQVALSVHGAPPAVAGKYEALGASVRAAPFKAIGIGKQAHAAATRVKTKSDELVNSVRRASKAHLRGLPAQFVIAPTLPPSALPVATPTQDPRTWFARIAQGVAQQAKDAAAQTVVQAAHAAHAAAQAQIAAR